MPRGPRAWTDPRHGCYHLVSRTADQATRFSPTEKEFFLRLMERLARAFFLRIHAFCVMGNHFHILATSGELEAAVATDAELLRRYRLLRGPNAEPPSGSIGHDGELEPDPDGGVERLRRRLGSVSRFMQELKQSFSRWYNHRHDRRGYLWHDRFKSVLVAKSGDADLVVAAYIDLNPIRAKLVRVPEAYPWSSVGLPARSPQRAARLLAPIAVQGARGDRGEWYRLFLYEAGAVPVRGKPGRIPASAVAELKARVGALAVAGLLTRRCRNFSEGVAVGTAAFVTEWQRRAKRKTVNARPVAAGGSQPPASALFATRTLRVS